MFEFNVFDKYFENQDRLSKQLINDIIQFVSEKIDNQKELNKQKEEVSKDKIFTYIINYLESKNCGISPRELTEILAQLKYE